MKTYLYDELDIVEKYGAISQDLPNSITDNLNPKFTIRPYQAKAFARFNYFQNHNFPNKPNFPYHLLFNMATGSGKTMIMAGLMLYLYEKGYRNFLFFVNSSNIIKKTQDNFLNSSSSKYLFSQKIMIDSKEVFLKEVQNFENADNENINICFTTIQQLHSDLNNTKECSITFEDFQEKKLILIADEAHHLNTSTKKQGDRRYGSLFGTWENTVAEILKQNFDNILLEFTATLDYESHEISTKYANKVIYRYDLAQFRKDGFSKEIDLIRSYFDEKQRIIQALILNLYRQELAATKHINLKPVILFKAKRTIAESELNKEKFHALIENLDAQQIEAIKEESTVGIVQKAFQFFEEKHISFSSITQRIQSHFKPSNCISANDDKEAERNQLTLNSLEDDTNPIRAIFAVQKLNEGWDVLNLFDIVRLYKGQNTGGSNAGKKGNATLSEAQLIGRGARYFPFNLNDNEDKFKRKYKDSDFEILEQLYYHTKEESRYVSELKAALVESGIYEDDNDLITRELKLKESFKSTHFYKKGVLFYNKKVEKSYNNVKSFTDLGVKKRNIEFTLSSGIGKTSGVFDFELEQEMDKLGTKDVNLLQIPHHIIQYSLSANPFYYFNSLQRLFPNLTSLYEFITSNNYLGNLAITFLGTTKRRNALTNTDYFKAVNQLLITIENDLKSKLTEFEGTSTFYPRPISEIFKDKSLRINKNDERAKGDEEILKYYEWYAYNTNYGTSEEKDFINLFARKFEQFGEKYENIYIIRNERVIKIYDSQGRTFEPDFLLFAKQKKEKNLSFQVFIEPKGKQLIKEDAWKQDFLEETRKNNKIIELNTDFYKITAVPFYNSNNVKEFEKILFETLEI
jgi:type III restriction enzyme